jgi:cbb3-type cytochrome oxidase subunit 3
MYKNVMQSIEGIGIYPLISLLMFFLFFVAVLVWFVRADKDWLKEMAELPLDSSETNHQSQQGE